MGSGINSGAKGAQKGLGKSWKSKEIVAQLGLALAQGRLLSRESSMQRFSKLMAAILLFVTLPVSARQQPQQSQTPVPPGMIVAPKKDGSTGGGGGFYDKNGYYVLKIMSDEL